MTQMSGIRGGPETGSGPIQEPGIAIGGARRETLVRMSSNGRGSTSGVDGDIARGQAHKVVNTNEIAATRVATTGRHQKNETGTRTLAVASIADENTGDTRAETTRSTTNVDGGRAAHQILSKINLPYLTNVAAPHRFRKTEVQLEIARYAIYLHPRDPHRRLLKTMQWT